MSNQLIKNVLSGELAPIPPIWLMRQAGRYLPEYRALRAKAGSFLDLCYAPEMAAEVTLQPVTRFDMDAAILFSDILVIPHALGQDLRFAEGEGPRLPPIRDRAGIDSLSEDGLHARLAPVYETVTRVRAALPAHKTLIGFAGAPWTVACYMIEGRGSKDFEAAKTMMFGAPDLFDALMQKVEAATIAYLLQQAKHGADVLQLFDSWSGLLDPLSFDRYVTVPAARIRAAVKAQYPDVPMIGFARGAGASLIGYAAKSGMDGFGLDTQVDRKWARAALGPKVCLQGNLDPAALLAGGKALTGHIDAICDALDTGPFIFNLGHGIIKETPPEHVAQLVTHIRARTA